MEEIGNECDTTQHTIVSYHDNGAIENEYTCTICELLNGTNYTDYDSSNDVCNTVCSDVCNNVVDTDNYTILNIKYDGVYLSYTPDSVMTFSAEYSNGELNGEKRELLKYVEGSQIIMKISDWVYGKCSGFVCYAYGDYSNDLTPITFIRFEYWSNNTIVCRNDREICEYMKSNYIPKKDALLFTYIRNCSYRKIVDYYSARTPNRVHKFGRTVHDINSTLEVCTTYAKQYTLNSIFNYLTKTEEVEEVKIDK